MQDEASKETNHAERAEFELLIAAFSNSPRTVRLLRYIGDNYFARRQDELCEYSIATEVFGRSTAVFDPAEDAIARVETHRLRKRLKDYYGGEGKNHAVQFTLPHATYIPVFIHASHAELASLKTKGETGTQRLSTEVIPVLGQGTHKEQEPRRSIAAIIPILRERPRMLTFIGIAAIFVVLTGLALMLTAHHERRSADQSQAVATSSASAPSIPRSEPIRLLAGYFGSPQIDGSGGIWRADQYFEAGWTYQFPPVPIAKTTSPFIYKHSRNGAYSYKIPLPPGVYELHLYFATTDSPVIPSTFYITVNGQLLLGGFDIDSDAFGQNIADERVFRDISPASDGFLYINAGNEMGTPELNAIEILPGFPHRQLPIRIIARSTPYMDHMGQIWHPDDFFLEGHLQTDLRNIAGTPDPDLFTSERFGHFFYTIPVDTRDRYTVVLHFAEHYFGPNAPGSSGVGSRVFRVLCNGETILDNFDIYKEVGSMTALTKTIYHLKPTAKGKLNLMFEPIANNASVSSIEVLDESK
jgi:hypothetical protein